LINKKANAVANKLPAYAEAASRRQAPQLARLWRGTINPKFLETAECEKAVGLIGLLYW
jgi:hypothetical protein